ncbi:MAG TPA: hypothetical protein VK982_08980 [Bacteroidales bacterium]|nr:hypothetical protein [Bacteroidales bacterium]
MKILLFLQYLSYFSSFLPLIGAIGYWYKKKFFFDSRVDLLGCYFILYSITQNIMLILSLSGIHNLFILKILAPIETFVFSFIVLSFQVKSKRLTFFLAFLFTLIVIIIDIAWGKPNTLPVESLIVQSIVITLIGMSAIPSIRIKKDYESAFFYFIFGILFSSVNTLLGVGFIELAPELSYNIQAIINIISYSIFAWGFYVIFKSESEIKKQ